MGMDRDNMNGIGKGKSIFFKKNKSKSIQVEAWVRDSINGNGIGTINGNGIGKDESMGSIWD